MLRWAILLLLACSQRPAAPQPSCLDQELQRRGLNEFGDPPGMVYAGGTPLFDERTGKRTERDAYVFARHPDIARSCQR